MKKRMCAFLVFVACFVCAIPVALADPQFSERDVRGPYVFAFDGFAGTTATSPGTPLASVGRFTADGRGNIEDGVRTFVVGGTAQHQTFKCTYSVNDDGTGHADCLVNDGPEDHFDFVIVSRGDEAYFTAVPATVPGAGITTLRGQIKRQR